MGLTCDIKEYFPDKKKHNFKLDIFDMAGKDIYNTFELFAEFHTKIAELVNKLFGGIDEYNGELTFFEIKELLELIKMVVNRKTFLVELKKAINERDKMGWIGSGLWYSYKENGKEYHVDNYKRYDHNEAGPDGKWKYEYSFHKVDYVKFMLDFLELLVKNKSGLKTKLNY